MEIWADIDGFPGYQVSTEGRVRSFWRRLSFGRGSMRKITDEPTLVSASDDGMGYLKVGLRRDGKLYMRRVHRLVAETFIPNDDPETKNTVDHIIGGPEGKLNNTVENLQWLSGKENRQKAWRDGLCDSATRANEKPIIARNIDTGVRLYFPSISEASKRLGLNRNTLVGYLWRYGTCYMNNDRYHYELFYASREDNLLYGGDEWEINGGAIFYDDCSY